MENFYWIVLTFVVTFASDKLYRWKLEIAHSLTCSVRLIKSRNK